MVQVITIATGSHFHLARRLWASLRNSGNSARLTIFCDTPDTFAPLASDGYCEVRLLPQITTLGVKRAKFAAYQEALAEGGFLYLDSDTIVLQPIEELITEKLLTGCFDDLDAVSGIADRRHPWPGDPTLENERFINSGVFYAPETRRGFFQEVYERSLNDQLWNRYILPGRLYDNSFLCAHINLLNEPVHYADETVYNWQGLSLRGELQVARKGNSLVNLHNHKTLKIAHFAGISDPDQAMCNWPVEVTSLLGAMGSAETGAPQRAFVEFLGTLNQDFAVPQADPLPAKMLNLLSRETMGLVARGLDSDFTSQRNYLLDPAAMVSLGYSIPYAGTRWNGLECGNAYLDGEEYNFLQRVLQCFNIRTALETGAGETSVLMRKLGVEALSIEASSGPWLERALDQGCRCALVNFDSASNRFEEQQLKEAISSFAPDGHVDLLFIDSPPGTAARRGALAQLGAMIRPTYVLLHDALRDARVAFECQHRLGMDLVEFLPSERGFVLLRSRSAGPEAVALTLPPFDCQLEVLHPRIRIEWPGMADDFSDQLDHLAIQVTNLGSDILSSRYTNPVCLSYHLNSLEGSLLVWDGDRIPLPFDILPDNTAEFRPGLGLPDRFSEALLTLTLVQENVCWFDRADSTNSLTLRLWRSKEGTVMATRSPNRSMAA